MVKPPAVYLAGMLRMLGDRISTEDWVWLSIQAGQLLFYPPNVSGWNDDRWLDTSTFHARWNMAERVLQKHAYHPDHTKRGEVPSDPGEARRPRRLVLGHPGLRRDPPRAPRPTPRRRWVPPSPTTTDRGSSRP